MVFWINTPFDPLPGEGGRPLRYWLLSQALVAAGHRVVLWGSDFHHITKQSRVVPSVYESEGIQVRLVPTQPYRRNIGLGRLRSHAKYVRDWQAMAKHVLDGRVLEAPDCVVVSMPPLGLYDAAANLRKDWGCRVVIDVQDAWPETFYQLVPPWAHGIARRVLARLHAGAVRAYRGANGVTAVCSRYIELAKVAGCCSRTEVFRLGCPLPKLTTVSMKKSVLRFCYIGNLGKSYDLQTVMRGISALISDGVGVTLDIAGDGPRRSEIERYVRGGGQGIRLHGYIDQVKLVKLLGECDVGLVPMRSGSWVAVPNKVTDYAAAGLAIINGLEGETKSLLNEYGAGLDYRCGDVASFMRAVQRYADDRTLLARHREGARRLAESVFDPDKIYPGMAVWLANGVTRNVAE